MISALIAIAIVLGVMLWGWWNYRMGLRRGETIGTYQTLLKVLEPEELHEMIREQLQEEVEVEELKRRHRLK